MAHRGCEGSVKNQVLKIYNAFRRWLPAPNVQPLIFAK